MIDAKPQPNSPGSVASMPHGIEALKQNSDAESKEAWRRPEAEMLESLKPILFNLGHASAEMTRRYQRKRDRFRVNLTKAAWL